MSYVYRTKLLGFIPFLPLRLSACMQHIFTTQQSLERETVGKFQDVKVFLHVAEPKQSTHFWQESPNSRNCPSQKPWLLVALWEGDHHNQISSLASCLLCSKIPLLQEYCICFFFFSAASGLCRWAFLAGGILCLELFGFPFSDGWW